MRRRVLMLVIAFALLLPESVALAGPVAAASCSANASIQKVSTTKVNHLGSGSCSGSGITQMQIAVYEDRCSVELFGNCVTWQVWYTFTPCVWSSGGFHSCGWFQRSPGNGRYKTRVTVTVWANGGSSSTSDESNSIVLP